MKDWIRNRLERIDELFPKERLERSKRRYSSLWDGSGSADRLPFVYSPFLFGYYDDFNSFDDPDERLGLLLEECILHGRLGDDFIPSLFPGCRQSTIPSMFGAREISIDGFFSCERPTLGSEGISGLPTPSVLPGSVASKWLQLEEYYLEETEARIPIHVCDMQGPFDVCGQLIGLDDFFVSALTEPEAWRGLMDKSTGAFIEFWNRQKELLGANFIGTHLFGWGWMPENIGATLSADSIVMVSRDFFDEFYKPDLMKIAKRFDGLVLHSCGDFAHLMDSLKSVPLLKGIHAGQMSLKELVQAGLDRNHVAICYTAYEDIDEMLGLVAEKDLRLDATINLCPFPPEHARHPEKWSEEDWRLVMDRDGQVVERFEVVSSETVKRRSATNP